MGLCQKFLFFTLFISSFLFLFFTPMVWAADLNSTVTVNQAIVDDNTAHRILPAKVFLVGQAYPNAEISLLLDGILINTIKAEDNGDFTLKVENIYAGVYSFSLQAKDSLGRRSIIVSYTLTVVNAAVITVSPILIPPIISLEKENLIIGEKLKISGQSLPNSKVFIHLSHQGDDAIIESFREAVFDVSTDKTGYWQYLLDTASFLEGSYGVRSRVTLDEKNYSNFSQMHYFDANTRFIQPIDKEFLQSLIGDFNLDNKVDVVDFSILLYWWGRQKDRVDIDKSGLVDVIDFSIFLYYWTG